MSTPCRLRQLLGTLVKRGKRLINNLRGACLMTLVALALFLTAVGIILTTPLRFLFPVARWRQHFYQRVTNQFPVWWARVNYVLLGCFNTRRWTFSGSGDLQESNSYLMISNHQSWCDILVLAGFFAKKTPSFKFFMKKQLLWSLPLGGLACFCLGFPMMRRHSHAEIRKNPALKNKDIETTKQACDLFKRQPTTIVNFVEGTRYTPRKARRQETPFKHLLRPKAGGASIVLNNLSEHLSGIINVTIAYQDKAPSLWRILAGHIPKIHIEYELLPITAALQGNYHEDRAYRAQFQQWLNQLWQRKDAIIAAFNTGTSS